MSILRFIKLDLTGRLRSWTKRYRGDTRKFDHRNVICHVSPNGPTKYEVFAGSYCSDANVLGPNDNVVWFYRTGPKFKSRIEAEEHLESEVQRAFERNAETSFYRSRLIPYIAEGRAPEDVAVQELYRNGKWEKTEHLPSFRRCISCGCPTDASTCPKCCEPIWS